MRVVLVGVSIALSGGCVGQLRSTGPEDDGSVHMDAAIARSDAAVDASAVDAQVTPGEDAYAEGIDAYVTAGEDAYVAAIDAYVGVDAYVAPRDAYVGPDAYVAPDPTCTTGTPLATPIAGCMPTVPASTGDPHADCVARINQFRCACQHLPPLMRWTAGEACADTMAQYDHDHPTMPHAGFAAGICSGGYGQNECPGWPSVPSTVNGCLQQMWDEGPGDFYGPPPHGHYINMSSTSFTRVACGFYSGSRGVYAVQNFQ